MATTEITTTYIEFCKENGLRPMSADSINRYRASKGITLPDHDGEPHVLWFDR